MRTANDPIYIEFITRLRSARKNKNLTQTELAELLGKPQSFVSKIETCERRIDLIEAAQWCSILEISLNELLPTAIRSSSKEKIFQKD